MSKPMTKTQLVAALSEEMGTDKKSASAALDAICGLITREVSGGGAHFTRRRKNHVPSTPRKNGT